MNEPKILSVAEISELLKRTEVSESSIQIFRELRRGLVESKAYERLSGDSTKFALDCAKDGYLAGQIDLLDMILANLNFYLNSSEE